MNSATHLTDKDHPAKDAIKSSLQNKDIIIKPTKVGGAIAVMNTVDYIAHVESITTPKDWLLQGTYL